MNAIKAIIETVKDVGYIIKSNMHLKLLKTFGWLAWLGVPFYTLIYCLTTNILFDLNIVIFLLRFFGLLVFALCWCLFWISVWEKTIQ